MKVNTAALFVLTVLFVQINSIYSQGGQTAPNCSAIKIDCPRNTTCLKKARESMNLSCYFTQSWFKTPDIEIGRFGKVINQEKYEIIQCVDDSQVRELPRTKEILTIKSLDSTDIGYKSYYANVDSFNIVCSYDIFVFGKIVELL